MKNSKRISRGPWPRLQRAWDVRAACNFIGGGTGTGLLVAALIAAYYGQEWLLPALIGLAFIGFGLLMVWFEIGRPWRALNVFLHPQTSWMTREGVVALPLFGFGGGALVAQFVGYADIALALLAGATFCAVIFLYCQSRILRGARGIPTWREPALMPYILVSGLAEGAALFAAIIIVFRASIAPWVIWSILVLLVARGLAWFVYRTILGRNGAPEASFDVLNRLALPFYFLGHALPIVIILTTFIGMPDASLLYAVAGMIIAITGWQTKLTLITRAAQTQGVAIPRTPLRGRGKSHPGTRPGWVKKYP